jgi:hypothetical protein
MRTPRRSTFILASILLGSLLAGCAPTSVATPTSTPTATATATPEATPMPPLEPQFAQVVIGKDYSYYPGTISHDQATVEFVDLADYPGKMLTIRTETKGFSVRLGIYRGKIDLARWWGDTGPLMYESAFGANPSTQVFVYPSNAFISIVYITRPIELETPENLEITRELTVSEPSYPVDYSKTFVTEYWTFPDEILDGLVDPSQFNDNMNREYTALKDLLGRDSDVLDADGHVRLVVADIPDCGWAGNPIQMNSVCMQPDVLNTGNPGWGPAHELGHDFVGPYSYCWGEADSHEGWANFMAFYAYDNGIFINSDFDEAFWANVWETSPKQTDILQGMIVRLSHQSGWEVARTFFRKYISSDPARAKNDTEKKRQAVRYLAESAREVTGDEATYDYVVNFLAGKGFPRP